MAVEWPYARVVRLELHHQMPVGRHDVRVSPEGIVGVDDRPIPWSGAGRQHLIVMPVHVQRVRECQVVEPGLGRVNLLVLPHNADHAGFARAVHVPLRLVRLAVAALVGDSQERFVEVHPEGLVVHQVVLVAGRVKRVEDLDRDRLVGSFGGDFHQGNRGVERLVGALEPVFGKVLWLSGGGLVGVGILIIDRGEAPRLAGESADG